MFRLKRSVDLDNNATTAVSRPVRKEMTRVLRRQHGNPSALHGAARAAASIIEESRETIADALGVDPPEIVFTGSATEANNQVLKTLAEHAHPTKNRILTTPIEHPSIMHTLEHLEGKGFKVDFIPVDREGRVSPETLEEQIDASTFLVCCMLANNEIGTIQDIETISQIAHRHDIPVLSDCVQALGKIPIDLRQLGADYATFSAHKLHGPKGVGALFVRSGAAIAPLLHGGHQEAGLRAGTEGVHNIAGFARACLALPTLLAQSQAVAARTAKLLDALRRQAPGLVVNSPSEHCLPNTLSITFPGVENSVLMAVLDMNGIAVSTGSACSAAETTPSHVLTAQGLSAEQADETIRISLSSFTSERDLRYAIRVFGDFFSGKAPSIPYLSPSQATEAFLSNEDNYLLDIRFEVERKLQKGLPHSHNAAVISFAKYLHHIPKEKNIVVICSTGMDATAIAYSLHKRGYRRVCILLGGVIAWQIQQPKLYKRLAGTNITKLAPQAGVAAN